MYFIYNVLKHCLPNNFHLNFHVLATIPEIVGVSEVIADEVGRDQGAVLNKQRY